MMKLTDFSPITQEELEQKVRGLPRYADNRSIRVTASPNRVWSFIEKIGGRNGWYHANWLWNLRGHLDWMIGGVGLRRKPASVQEAPLKRGDEIGFWRVLEIIPESRLVLLAEMKLPGVATLEFQIKALQNGTCELRQIVQFCPMGYLGQLYWYSVLPFHYYIFRGMIKKIGKLASLR